MRDEILNEFLSSDLAALIGADGIALGESPRFVANFAMPRRRQGGDAAGIDDPRNTGSQRRFHYVARRSQVVAYDFLRIGNP